MFGLLSLHRVVSSSRPPRSFARPNLECLEERWTPDGSELDGSSGVNINEMMWLTLDVEYNLGRSITLSGNLSGDGDTSDITITIGGQASGSTMTDANGDYEITLDATDLGTVTASAGELASAEVTLTDEVPVITNFEAIEGQDNIWTFRGTLSYHRTFESLTVYFGGQPVSIQNQSVSTNSSGEFELLLTLNGTGTDNGTVWARAASPWGLNSEDALDTVFQTGT